MYALGFLESNVITKKYLLPDLILDPTIDVFLFDNITRSDYDCWDYRLSAGITNYISQLDKIVIKKSFKIPYKHLNIIFLERKQKILELVSFVRNRALEYDEDDTSTWVDNFISVVWESEKVYFSHETPEGELLWNLYGSLELLKEEIDLGGALCVVVID